MDKGILFNTEMVKAILEGRKTQTRRIIKPQPDAKHIHKLGFITGSSDSSRLGKFGWGTNEHGGVISLAKPPYRTGDILWVRETWAQTWTPCSNDTGFVYKADGEPPTFPYWGNASQHKDEVWIPSIHMPREAARIFLKVTNVRVERLQEISEEDSLAEGIKEYPVPDATLNPTNTYVYGDFCNDTLKEAFSALWDGIYGNWNENPWVWVVELERADEP